jgi:hypothetical protein
MRSSSQIRGDSKFRSDCRYPDRTAFFGYYFQIGGDPPGAMDCGFQALNERIGDLH